MKVLTVTLGAAIAFGSLAAISAVPQRSLAAASSKPSYTNDQATKGQTTYYAKCAMCHGANLEGVSGPALKGKDANLQAQTVKGVYAYTITEMPVGNAGGLPSDDYVNIMAFLLKSNGHEPGSVKLSVASLKSASTKIGGPK